MITFYHKDCQNNPDNVPQSMVDPENEGWRLMLKEEIGTLTAKDRPIQCWLPSENSWSEEGDYHGNARGNTYRVKIPLPSVKLAPASVQEKEEWADEAVMQAERRGMFKFLIASQHVLLANPFMDTYPAEAYTSPLVFRFGKSGDYQLHDTGEIELNGVWRKVDKVFTVIP